MTNAPIYIMITMICFIVVIQKIAAYQMLIMSQASIKPTSENKQAKKPQSYDANPGRLLFNLADDASSLSSSIRHIHSFVTLAHFLPLRSSIIRDQKQKRNAPKERYKHAVMHATAIGCA